MRELFACHGDLTVKFRRPKERQKGITALFRSVPVRSPPVVTAHTNRKLGARREHRPKEGVEITIYKNKERSVEQHTEKGSRRMSALASGPGRMRWRKYISSGRRPQTKALGSRSHHTQSHAHAHTTLN